ncbi:MAG: radical SAM protein, partial [Planctomycetota bacterium]|nr:radical SAM protein [Planctomycetota bacterium]
MSACEHLPTMEIDALAERILRAAPGGRWPLGGSMDLTAHCNLACRHCYMRPYRHEPELSTAEIKRILAEIAEAGCLFLLLTGGEPLLRPDFLEIYRAARQRGLVMTLFTNGTLITEEVAAALAEQPPLWVEISLYGASEQTTARVTGKSGMFSAALRGIRLLQRQGLALRVKSLLLTANAAEIWQIKRLVEDMGIDFHFNGEIFGRLGGDPSPRQEALPDAESVRIEMADPLHQRIWESAARAAPAPRRGIFRCSAGRRGFHIGPYGDLNVCILLREPGYSLRGGSFQQGWEKALPEYLSCETEKDECDGCRLLALCSPCLL